MCVDRKKELEILADCNPVVMYAFQSSGSNNVDTFLGLALVLLISGDVPTVSDNTRILVHNGYLRAAVVKEQQHIQ